MTTVTKKIGTDTWTVDASLDADLRAAYSSFEEALLGSDQDAIEQTGNAVEKASDAWFAAAVRIAPHGREAAVTS